MSQVSHYMISPTIFRTEEIKKAKQIAIWGMAGSGVLAIVNIVVGWMAGSTSVVAAGIEFAGDVLASGVVLFGMTVASRPPDENHPYGHGRSEMLAGLLVGLLLAATGLGISIRSLQGFGQVREAPLAFGVWPLMLAIVVKTTLTVVKIRYGRKIQSAALVADAWNDAVDILSAFACLTALGLTLYSPDRFLEADNFGGVTVGLIIIFTGLNIVWHSSLQLMDTMPDEVVLEAIRETALRVPGALGVEKCYARKTGLQYHVDLHLEVDPNLSVQVSHDIATQVRIRIREEMLGVADVLVHVEHSPTIVQSN